MNPTPSAAIERRDRVTGYIDFNPRLRYYLENVL
jgi:aminoglycoside/choline kinase family phosphotransferase